MRHFIRVLFAFIVLIAVPILANALQDSEHPIIDKGSKDYQAPFDLNSVTLKRLLEYQEFYHRELKRLNDLVAGHQSPELATALLEYDTSRLKIVEVIPKLITAYSLNNDMKKQLLTYSETFAGIRESYHSIDKVSLADYRAYDFRLGVAYQSMLYMLAQDDALYRKIQKDMRDERTVIGNYVGKLDISYQKVESANAAQPEYYLIRQIESELQRVRNEINQR